MPGALNAAVVEAFVGSPKVTVPGPLIFVHRVVMTAPCGNPSSVMPGENDRVAGSTTLRCARMLTFGAWFACPSAPSARVPGSRNIANASARHAAEAVRQNRRDRVSAT